MENQRETCWQEPARNLQRGRRQLALISFLAMTNIRHFWVGIQFSLINQCRQLKQCEMQFFKIN